MNEELIRQIGTVIGWIGLLSAASGGLIAGIRALIRGPKEDKALESELQDKVTAMAAEWLDRAEKRLKEAEDQAKEARDQATKAEERASKAEAEVHELSPRVEEMEFKLLSALNTIGELYPWGKNGGGDPEPHIPAWIYEWLHNQGKGE